MHVQLTAVICSCFKVCTGILKSQECSNTNPEQFLFCGMVSLQYWELKTSIKHPKQKWLNCCFSNWILWNHQHGSCREFNTNALHHATSFIQALDKRVLQPRGLQQLNIKESKHTVTVSALANLFQYGQKGDQVSLSSSVCCHFSSSQLLQLNCDFESDLQ